MGGAVAQLLWRDHPRLVRGLVLCSTAANFGVGPVERLAAAITVAAAAAVRTVPPIFRVGFDIASSFATRDVEDPARAWLNGDYGGCSFETFAAAAAALARFTSRDWVGGIDVPTAVIVTRQDRLIPPARQRELAGLIPGAVVHEVDGGHGAFVTAAERFLPPLLLSCRAVAEVRTP
jgi:3-oxoadipate enol-lactonase